MQILIIADPYQATNTASDTGYAFAEEASRRGHFVWWAEPQHLIYHESVPAVFAQSLNFTSHGTVGKLSEEKLFFKCAQFDSIWIRKEPPLNPLYVSMCWVLKSLEKKCLIANTPSALLNFHEKNIPFMAYQDGFLKKEEIISSYLFFDINTFNLWKSEFEKEHDHLERTWIFKPWRGHGGRGVHKINSFEKLPILLAASEYQDGFILQEYISEIEQQGDRRVFVFDGKVCGDFVRLPQEGSFLSNLAQGGRSDNRIMNEKEKDVSEKIARYLQKNGIMFAGLDLINGRLNEVNITSPTGVRPLKEIRGIDLSARYVDWVEEKVKALKAV